MNSLVKLLTKLLANKLQQAIMKLIHENQYEFIKSRSIQDWLAWIFQYLDFCHKSKREFIILKLDFKKVFDKMEQKVIIQMMEKKGLGQKKWLQWIQIILNSGHLQFYWMGY
jgi:retron-type reverse transcriptase